MKQKKIKYFVIMLFCTAVILMTGYAGIYLGGNQILKSNGEPHPVRTHKGTTHLFYSSIDDIELFPWNLYQEEDAGQLNTPEFFTDEYMLQEEVFYTLISCTANISLDEVFNWYEQPERKIQNNMRSINNGDYDIFYYQEEVTLNGNIYEVKLSCSNWFLYSFSCLKKNDDNVKEGEQWKENKETFLKNVEENSEYINFIFNQMGQSYFPEYINEFILLYDYLVDMCNKGNLNYSIDEIKTKRWALSIGEEMYDDEAYSEEKYSSQIPVGNDSSFQVIELNDCILLLRESDNETTIAIYYDVITKQPCGFHYLN